MQAIVQDRYGSPDVLELRDIEKPSIGEHEVLVRVHAAGVDRGVWHMVTGLPLMIRIMGFGFSGPKVPVPGNDVAGTVEAIGRSVTRFRPGDEVFGGCEGSFAEYASAKETNLVGKPGSLTFQQAAAVPVSALTALQGLRDQGEVTAGQSVLIVGASGGVGTFAVQIAKAFGAEVTGVCSTPKIEMVRSLGADHVIDYTQETIGERSRRYEVVVDIGGNRSLSELRRCLTPRGTLVIIGGENGGRWLGGTHRLLGALLLSPFVGQKLRTFIAKGNREDLETLRQLIVEGTLKPVIDRTFALDEAADAIRYLQEGRARGKTVINVA